jgi:hypothetical protein
LFERERQKLRDAGIHNQCQHQMALQAKGGYMIQQQIELFIMLNKMCRRMLIFQLWFSFRIAVLNMEFGKMLRIEIRTVIGPTFIAH